MAKPIMTAKEWKSGTFSVGKVRSEQLKAVDRALEAYQKTRTQTERRALVRAIEVWVASKSPNGKSGGYAAVLKGARNRTSAVTQLIDQVRGNSDDLRLPPFWPDQEKGSTVVVQLDVDTLDLLRAARFEATKRSVMMISAMRVDWKAFAFDQATSAATTASGIGHTDFSKEWTGGADQNLSSAGGMVKDTSLKLISLAMGKAREELGKDERVNTALMAIGSGLDIVLGVVKNYLLKGFLTTTVPLVGPIKEGVDAIYKGGKDLRLVYKSFERVNAVKPLLKESSDAATAIESFHSLLKIETGKSIGLLAYKLLKDAGLVVTEVLTLGAMTVVQVVSALVELIVGFCYQLYYSIVFQSAVKQCRQWVKERALPMNLDLRTWIAGCPILGAYFFVGLSAGGGSVSALSMFGQGGTVNSTAFQDASTKLLRVRQAAAAYIQANPVKVKWADEKYEWIDGLVKSDALSASVGLDITKIHHFRLSENATTSEKFKHRFYQASNKVLKVGGDIYGAL
jgi:hypothetical protein